MDYMTPLIQPEQIEQVILLMRGQRVMLDRDLAALYGVETKNLNKAVLRSPRAVQVNIAIMRVFVRLREALALHKELAHKLAELERKIEGHDTSIRVLFDAIRELAAPPVKPRREIGFHVREDRVPYRVKRK
jgi:hypothetical protein